MTKYFGLTSACLTDGSIGLNPNTVCNALHPQVQIDMRHCSGIRLSICLEFEFYLQEDHIRRHDSFSRLHVRSMHFESLRNVIKLEVCTFQSDFGLLQNTEVRCLFEVHHFIGLMSSLSLTRPSVSRILPLSSAIVPLVHSQGQDSRNFDSSLWDKSPQPSTRFVMN